MRRLGSVIGACALLLCTAACEPQVPGRNAPALDDAGVPSFDTWLSPDLGGARPAPDLGAPDATAGPTPPDLGPDAPPPSATPGMPQQSQPQAYDLVLVKGTLYYDKINCGLFDGKCDVYVKVAFAGQDVRSKTIKSAQYPVWNQKLLTADARYFSTGLITIVLMDDDLIFDNEICRFTHKISAAELSAGAFTLSSIAKLSFSLVAR